MSSLTHVESSDARSPPAFAAPAPSEKIGLTEKLAYAAGDAASVLFFRTFASYIMFFCTDIVGLAAGAIGTLLWTTRIFDACIDPLMGAICDRTKSRHGRFRPWLRWMAVPLALSAIAVFAVPDWSQAAKLVYVYATYTLMMIFYTAINIPYGALMGVMTRSSDERTALASFRFYGAYAADFVVKSSILYLVVMLGGAGDGKTATKAGYVWTMTLYSALAVGLFWFTFHGTRERIEPPKEQEMNVRKDLRELIRNGPWVWVIVLGMTSILWIAIRDAAVLYYVRYYIVGAVDEGDRFASIASKLVALGQVGALVGVGLTGWLTRLFGGKKKTFLVLTLLTAVVGMGYRWVGPGQLLWIYAIQVVTQALMAPLMPLFWAMIADTADYSEWKFGRRFTGLTFSAGTFSQKFGWALGPALASYLLVFYGYQANIVQSERTIEGLRAMMSWIPSGLGLVGACLVLFYGIDRRVELQMSQELTERKVARGA